MTPINKCIAWLKWVWQKLVNAVRAGWRRPEARHARELVWKHLKRAMVASVDEWWTDVKDARVPTPERPFRRAA